MLRNKLLATTMLMMFGSVSFFPAQSAGISGNQSGGGAIAAAGATPLQAGSDFGSPGKDRNREFLCTYGYETFYHYSYVSSWSVSWSHYAVPIKGKGASVSKIQVTDSEPSNSDSPKFNVGIYKNANGIPGSLIAGGTGKARGSCRLTTVVIPKTFLAAGKKYWIEENAPSSGAGLNAVSWGYNQNSRHNAYQQTGWFNAYSSSSSPWLPVHGPAPFVRVR